MRARRTLAGSLLALLAAACSSTPGPDIAANCEGNWRDLGDEFFSGWDRRIAKVSLVPLSDAPEQAFDSISSLRRTLPDDAEMRQMHIARGPASDRVPQEHRNVVVKAYLFAAARPTDKDFHLILGDKDCGSGHCFLNTEISALACGGDEALANARSQARSLLGSDPPSFYYRHFNPPIPVIVEGSLFYDVDHPAGDVGPRCCNPNTAWEIHPIRAIRAVRP